MDNFDGKDLYSFDNSSNKIDQGETSFDLNSFSSHITEDLQSDSSKSKKQNKKQTRKQRNLKIILTGFW